MMTWSQTIQVYLHRKPVDFRKQINGLSIIVQDSLELDPFSESCYVFVNRSRDRIKILYWQKNGFCLWLKRLEKDKFCWPKHLNDEVVLISSKELQWLLEGFDIWKQPPHQTLNYSAI